MDYINYMALVGINILLLLIFLHFRRALLESCLARVKYVMKGYSLTSAVALYGINLFCIQIATIASILP